MSLRTFWHHHIFALTAAICGSFVVLTALAMAFYGGGTRLDHAAPGYSFVNNFFSDLGRTTAYSGQANTTSYILFTIALATAGAALIAFFIRFPRFFKRHLPNQMLMALGSTAGILAGLCFIGVALTPSDVDSQRHGQLVYWAFEAFTAATVLYLPVMLRERYYPKRFALVFVVFAAMLTGYLVLIFTGPRTDTAEGLFVQVVGQKVIAYASIIAIMIQSLAAFALARSLHRAATAAASSVLAAKTRAQEA